MDRASALNETLRRVAPAAWSCLSALGRSAAFPHGVPAQSAEARGCRYDATIGQVTDGAGHPLPFPSLRRLLSGLDLPTAVLYGPQPGHPELRAAWARYKGLPDDLALPMVAVGLTQGIALSAELFAEPGREVLLPAPAWGNYRGIFGLRRGARLRTWPTHDEAGRFDVSAFAQAVAELPPRSVVVVNLPGNPSGYMPPTADLVAMRDALVAHPGPLVVLCDDAYAGMVWGEDAHPGSFFDLLPRDGRLVPVRVDGATKELGFFGGRLGFLTFGVPREAGEVLVDKAAALARATTSAPPGPSQAAVLALLREPGLAEEQAAWRATLRERWRALADRLPHVGGPLRALPFNAACFALVRVEGGGAEALRRALLAEGVGLVAVSDRALRLSYSSLAADDVAPLVEVLDRVARRFA